MQLAPATSAASTAPPARVVLRANLPDGIGAQLPDQFLDARIGKGTVASEFNRTLSFRIEGDGPPSQRRVVAQTPAGAAALQSKGGPAIERLVRRTMAVGDAFEGRENLRSITFLPDEHALKAAEALGTMVAEARDRPGPVRFSDLRTPAAERAAIKQFVRGIAQTSPQDNADTLAWNLDGDITVMPDVSRHVLATIGAYRLQDGDRITARPAAVRAEILRDDWDTLVHEANHSVTPNRSYSTVNGAWEEAIPSVLGRRDRSQAARDAGADIARIARDPGAGGDDAQLGWPGWNRRHLPQPTHEQSDSTAQTYGDGPETLRGLLHLAGIDRRTTAGRQTTIDLLQSRPAERVPEDIATAIATRLGIGDPSLVQRLSHRVRASILRSEGVRYVTSWLESKGIAVP